MLKNLCLTLSLLLSFQLLAAQTLLFEQDFSISTEVDDYSDGTVSPVGFSDLSTLVVPGDQMEVGNCHK